MTSGSVHDELGPPGLHNSTKMYAYIFRGYTSYQSWLVAQSWNVKSLSVQMSAHPFRDGKVKNDNQMFVC